MPRFLRCFVVLAALLGCEKSNPAPAPAPEVSAAAAPTTLTPSVETIEVPEVAVRAEGTTVHVTWSAPPGTGVNEEAPFHVRWNRSEGLTDAPPEMKATGASVKDGFRVTVSPLTGAPHATLDGDIHLVVCDVETHRVCIPVKRSMALGFVVTKDAPAETSLVVKLPAAKAKGS